MVRQSIGGKGEGKSIYRGFEDAPFVENDGSRGKILKKG